MKTGETKAWICRWLRGSPGPRSQCAQERGAKPVCSPPLHQAALQGLGLVSHAFILILFRFILYVSHLKLRFQKIRVGFCYCLDRVLLERKRKGQGHL